MEHFVAFVNASEMPFSKVKEFLEEKLPEIEPNDLSNKVAIVTGGNTGIGYEAAKAIASMNAKRIILACRNEEKSKAAIQKIKEETKYKGEIEAWKLDLASFKSVKEFSEKFLATKLPLDILVSNAGLVSSSPWEETADGLEITHQVNHLANVLLISNLYPALKQAATENKEEIKNKFPRVVVVASDVHYWAMSPQPDDSTPVQTTLIKKEHSNQMLNYSISKLYNVLFAQAFARKCPDNIWICSCSPGYTVSELGTKDSATGQANGTPRHNMLTPRPTYEGAKTIIHTAISPKVGESGKYYSEVRESPTRSSTTGESGVKFSENLWNDTVTVLKKYSPSSPIYDW